MRLIILSPSLHFTFLKPLSLIHPTQRWISKYVSRSIISCSRISSTSTCRSIAASPSLLKEKTLESTIISSKLVLLVQPKSENEFYFTRENLILPPLNFSPQQSKPHKHDVTFFLSSACASRAPWPASLMTLNSAPSDTTNPHHLNFTRRIMTIIKEFYGKTKPGNTVQFQSVCHQHQPYNNNQKNQK